MKKIKTVYLDMDGVMADFNKAFNIENREMMYKKNFFLKLGVIGQPNRAIKILKYMGYEIRILSSCIDSKYCKQEKKEWIYKNLPSIEEKEIILCNYGETKSSYVKGECSILVDDYGVNLKEWYNVGGTPIKFTSSKRKRLAKYINSLMELPSLLLELESERE